MMVAWGAEAAAREGGAGDRAAMAGFTVLLIQVGTGGAVGYVAGVLPRRN